ncbi:ubiquitin-binding protein cue5 [Friedmanniomyces endolithicus]|nr:ubiquitin-binding protein cue5 [Friedmanniomyces endolithicus]KAK1046408.1 ubiquitin-binding protein cue5 [Friedmanniomyces endolithicus]
MSDAARSVAAQTQRQQSFLPYRYRYPSIIDQRSDDRGRIFHSDPTASHCSTTVAFSAQHRLPTPTPPTDSETGKQLDMADAPITSPVKESATTREEPDFEAMEHEHEHEHEAEHEPEHEQQTGRVSPLGTETQAPITSAAAASPKPRVSFQDGRQENPPPKPPRPQSPQQQAENTLIEAFPSIDTKVVKAVLQASNGRVEPAFNALLGMSDPDFQPEQERDPPPPPQPPRPTQRQQQQQQRQPQTQLEADEIYARQLAEQYNTPNNYPPQHQGGAGAKIQPPSQSRYNQREPARRGPNQQRPNYEYDHDDARDHEQDRSFLDDDLPEIGKTIQQGFVDTQKKVNGWINTLRKRIDGDDDEEAEEDIYTSSQPGSRQGTKYGNQAQQRQQSGRQNFGSSQAEQLRGIRKGAMERDSAAAANAQRRRPSTELGGGGRRSTEAGRYDADPHELGDDAFERLELRDEEEEEMPPVQPPRTRGGRKWQPLSSAAPVPVEDDNDPFALGDDEEEKAEEVRKEDAERLKEKAGLSAESGEGGGEGKKTGLEESKQQGSINAEAAELLEAGEKD